MNVQNVDSNIKMKPTVISLFAGGGGSSLGYKLAGYKELLAIDFDKHAEKIFKLNFPTIKFWNRDITTVTSKEILEECKIKVGELDLLDGSPPCQGFSMAGKRKVSDKRNDLFKEYARILRELKPKVFIMENVSGMVKGQMKGIFIEAMKELKNCGYNVKCKRLNSMYYNVPQSRERLFFIGIRTDLIKNFEGWTNIFPEPNNNIITVKEALKDIYNNEEDLKRTNITNPIIKKGYKDIPKGKTGETIKKGSYFNTIRIDERKPSPTITKTRGLLHYKEKRYLTIKEVKKLCSFPKEYKLTGTMEQQWNRLGNAVMPNQMKAIAEKIKLKIFNNFPQ